MEKREGEGAFFWVEERDEQISIPFKHKRKVRPKKMEFVGWGSKSLLEFLESIGQDSSKQLSQFDVTAIINEYVRKFNLFHPLKKKKIVCDERLRSLFGKKLVPRIKIYDLLGSHFAANHVSSDDELSSSSDKYEGSDLTCKKQKVSSSEKKTPYQKKKVLDISSNCFAAIIPENIKLLYLRRSLVQELLKHPESFEGKLLGSYIRVKSDPNDFTQKNSHQLLPVTGVKNIPDNGHLLKEVLLQVPNMLKDIPVSMLSDEDFSKEECEDLRQRVNDGLMKRPTVVELQQKAQILHEDITKHWFPRELAYLQNLIDRANEKGWRRELFEYLERRQLLQTPSEQSRLLLEVPKVTADEVDPEATLEDPVQDVKELNSLLAISNDGDASGICFDSGAQQALASCNSDTAGATRDENIPFQGALNSSFVGGERKVDFDWEIAQIRNADVDLGGVKEANDENKTSNEIVRIELSDDEDREEQDFTSRRWFYLDPQGQVQGPVSGTELNRWNDAGYFLPDFKVWKQGQSAKEAILLTDMLSGQFGHASRT